MPETEKDRMPKGLPFETPVEIVHVRVPRWLRWLLVGFGVSVLALVAWVAWEVRAHRIAEDERATKERLDAYDERNRQVHDEGGK